MLVHFFRSSKNYFILITPSGTLGNFENNKASCLGITHFKFETKVFIRSIDFTQAVLSKVSSFRTDIK